MSARNPSLSMSPMDSHSDWHCYAFMFVCVLSLVYPGGGSCCPSLNLTQASPSQYIAPSSPSSSSFRSQLNSTSSFSLERPSQAPNLVSSYPSPHTPTHTPRCFLSCQPVCVSHSFIFLYVSPLKMPVHEDRESLFASPESLSSLLPCPLGLRRLTMGSALPKLPQPASGRRERGPWVGGPSLPQLLRSSLLLQLLLGSSNDFLPLPSQAPGEGRWLLSVANPEMPPFTRDLFTLLALLQTVPS